MTQAKQGLESLDPALKRFATGFAAEKGLPPEKAVWVPIPGDGSPRLFRRIRFRQPDVSYIIMVNAPADDYAGRENLAYLRIGRHLFEKGIPVPEIHRYNLDEGWFIMSDMGEESLQSWVSRHDLRVPLYKRVVEILFRLQSAGSEGFDPDWTCQTKRYDREVMRRYESEYFREAFLVGYLGLKKDWAELNISFEYLADEAFRAGDRFFLHRDFQSRNILVDRSDIGIIDWQGGRLGPPGYDLASLLIDPYVVLTAEERASVFRHYLHLLKVERPAEAEIFERTYPYLAIQRNLQILGAFSFLSKVRGKTYFEEYIPPALTTLTELLDVLKDTSLSALADLAESLRISFTER